MSFRLGYYERHEVIELQKKTQYAFDYAVELNGLQDLGYTNPTNLKQDLWTHIEDVLAKEYPDSNMKIFDMQIALSDTGFIDILQTKQQEIHTLKLMRKRKEKEEVLAKQEEKIKEEEKNIENYKNHKTKPYPVKAFITMHTIEAANALRTIYDKHWLIRC